MPANKSHHFVPQLLLRQFASDAGGLHLCLYRVKERKHVRQASIRDQCARDHYYGKDLGTEKALADLEGAADGIIKTIVTQERIPEPDTEAFATFLIFMMVQWSRTPTAVARQEEFDTQFIRNIAKADPKLPKDLRPHINSIRAKYPDGRSQSMPFAVQYCALLSDLRLKVLRAAGEAEFALGDAPVVLHNQWRRKIRSFGSTGFSCSGLQVFLPLSPKHLAILYDTDIYRVGESAPDFADVTDQEVLAFNSLQFAAAHSAIYYRSPSLAAHLDLIPSSAREDPLGMKATRYKEDGADFSYLVQLSNFPMNVDLKAGTVRLRAEAALVPLQHRARRLREESVALGKLINPEHFMRTRETPNPQGTGVFKLEE